jgi:hypothetical protein
MRPSSTELRLAQKFIFQRWQDRAAEWPGRTMPSDLSGACKFASLFAKDLWGGQLRGNFYHVHLWCDGVIVDLCESSQDVRQWRNSGIDVYRHIRFEFGHPEFQASLESCQPRVRRWLDVYPDWLAGEHTRP